MAVQIEKKKKKKMDFISLLKNEYGLDTSKKGKFIKHAGEDCDLRDLWKKDKIELYQSFQSKDVFNCNYIISFIGEPNDKARFIGIYDVLGKKDQSEAHITKEVRESVHARETDIFYNLKKRPGFEDIEGRIIISWGGSKQWHHWVDQTQKEIWKVLPPGFIKEFPGIDRVRIDFSEMKKIFTEKGKEGNPDWFSNLSNVNGVYLILDKKTGNQYIGSAYGTECIWQRWCSYVQTNGTGGNKKLEEIIKQEPNYATENFQYSILKTLPKDSSKETVINEESFLKECLGSRVWGLNEN